MYQIGEMVVYGVHGVCRVADMEERTVDRKKVRYLVLEPAEKGSSQYLVPIENPNAMAKLRPLASAQELEALLQSPQVRQNAWIPDENQRKQHYRTLICSADRTALLQMVCTLHEHKKAQLAAGRKLHLCDENFLRDAQRLLSTEFSEVLRMDSATVEEYVLSKLNL